MRRARQPMRGRGFGDAQCARQAADITDVRLRDIYRMHFQHSPPGRQLAVLLAAGHIYVQRVGHLLGLLQFPIRARLFKMRDAVVFQELSECNRFCRRIAGIGVHQQRAFISAKFGMHARHDVFAAPRPFVGVVPAFRGDAKFKRVKTELAAEFRKPRDFGFAVNVAFHGGRVGAHFSRRAAEQCAYRLAGAPAAQIPQRGVQSAERAVQVRAGELVLKFGNAFGEFFNCVRVGAERVRRDLPVHNLRGDVGVVGRGLPPSVRAVGRGRLHHADKFGGEGFNPGDVVVRHSAAGARAPRR